MLIMTMSNCFLQYKWTVIITREIKCFRINITLWQLTFVVAEKTNAMRQLV